MARDLVKLCSDLKSMANDNDVRNSSFMMHNFTLEELEDLSKKVDGSKVSQNTGYSTLSIKLDDNNNVITMFS